jgi:uncharacterized membrane protein HdeD (DUF308 family)
MTDIPIPTPSVPDQSIHFPRAWLWFVVVGIVQVVLGMIAIVVPHVIALATAVLIGWLLIIGGVIEIFQAIFDRGWRGFFIDLLAGILYLVLGFMIVANPGVALVTVTLLIAMFLIIGGIFRTLMALVDQYPHRGWMLLDGIISLLLGFAIWRRWPASALWVVGLFVGIELLLHGWSLIMLGLAGKRVRLGITSRLLTPET